MRKITKKTAAPEPSLTAHQLKRVSWVKINAPSKAASFIRAYSGKSRTAGIKAQCLDCVGCDKLAIRECASTACPLWPYRPYQVTPGKD